MKIALDISVLNEKDKTGIAVYTKNLVENLLELNSSDKFTLFGIATLSTFEYLNRLTLGRADKKILKMPAKFFRRAFLLWQKLNWPKIEKFTGSVDVFHSFNWYLPPQKNGLSVATVFDLTTLLFPQFHQEKTVQLEKLRLEKIAKYADLVVTISESSKKDFLKFFPEKIVEVIYPAADKRFSPKKDNAEIKILRKYGLQPGYFLSVATLEPRKNIKGLIEAYLAGKFAMPLVLVGGEGWKSELADILKANQKNIIVTGFVPDEHLPAIYRNALTLVYPSFYEGFGLPVLEAMQSGTPVIISKTSSLPEVAGKAALYITPENIKEITSAMKKITTNKELSVRMRREGLIQAKKFSWKKSAQKLNRLYHQNNPN